MPPYDRPPLSPSLLPLPEAREQVVALLQNRFANSDLTIEEFERRITGAYSARSSAQLEALIADFQSVRIPMTIPTEGKIVSVLANHERGGIMSVPRHFSIAAVLGNVELDLRDATFELGATEIEISAVFGNVSLTLPLGVRVDGTGTAFLGSFDHKLATGAMYFTDTERVIRITGNAVFASVTIDVGPSSFPSVTAFGNDASRRFS